MRGKTSITRLIMASSLAAAMLGGLSACEDPNKVKAPTERNTCYHIGYPLDANGKKLIKFNPVKTDVASIELCAAALETLRMTMTRQGVLHETIDGAYNGNFLFIEGRFISMATSYEGHRITLLVKTNDGRLVVPGAIVVEDPPESREPVTEPKNLPH
jgi:hypothetical protein